MKNKRITFTNYFANDTANCEIKKLSEKAKAGWRLKKISNSALFYILEKGEPSDLVYSFDYAELKDTEKDDYFELFEKSGWTHIDSYTNFHFFCAPAKTPPIVSEKSTRSYQYKKLSKVMLIAGLQYTFLSSLFYVMTKALKYYNLNIIWGILAVLLGVVFVMALNGYTSSAIYYRLSKKYR